MVCERWSLWGAAVFCDKVGVVGRQCAMLSWDETSWSLGTCRSVESAWEIPEINKDERYKQVVAARRWRLQGTFGET